MSKLFKKKEIFKVKSKTIEPTSIEDPSTADDFQKRGMAYYARKDYNAAETDLKKAIQLDNNHIDAYYSLGMVLKAAGKNEEAVAAFTQVINIISTLGGENTTKFDMLRKLALGHANEITQGDWNLEKEIWKHIDHPTDS
jgi:tetratricopeptide (TPR) repeat protein